MIRRTTASLLLLALVLVPSCRKRNAATDAATLANKVANRTITLYFESPESLLAPEQRTVELPENEAAAAGRVVAELLKGSANSTVPKLFPADTVLRGVYVLPDGNAIVDLGGATLTAGWNTGSQAELMAVFSIVQTLVANFHSVARVRVLINGQPASTLAGHIDLEKPLLPLPDVVAKR